MSSKKENIKQNEGFKRNGNLSHIKNRSIPGFANDAAVDMRISPKPKTQDKK